MNQSNLKYIIFLTFLYFGMPPHLQAQQIANWSSFYENGFIWNPALSARWTSTAVSLTHHKEWTGFEGAPQLSTLAVEVPFYKYGNLVRSSVGGYLEHDQVGPFRKISHRGYVGIMKTTSVWDLGSIPVDSSLTHRNSLHLMA